MKSALQTPQNVSLFRKSRRVSVGLTTRSKLHPLPRNLPPSVQLSLRFFKARLVDLEPLGIPLLIRLRLAGAPVSEFDIFLGVQSVGIECRREVLFGIVASDKLG
jgi:hypothetical protein